MPSRFPAIVLAIVLLLTASAILALIADAVRPPARGRDFQRLVGGLGFGPAADLDRCGFAFDPRLCPACAQDHGPIPGGKFFCPHHAGAIFAYPPLR
jgi:hypothetical protein